MKIKNWILFPLCFSAAIYGSSCKEEASCCPLPPQENPPQRNPCQGIDPWYTGPLLAPSASNLPKGTYNVQVYLFGVDTYANYTRHWNTSSISDIISVNPFVFLQAGLNSWLDTTLLLGEIYNKQKGEHVWRFQDIALYFGIQLLQDKKGTNTPSLRLVLSETFPTGKYQRFDPEKAAIDAGGEGSFRTGIGLNLSKTVYWNPCHPISWRAYIKATIPSHVKVHGFHAYGGGFGTDGTEKPYFGINQGVSLEYSFTQNWVFAFEYLYEFKTKSTFSGIKGFTSDEELDEIPAHNNTGYSHRFSLAPALEYNFSDVFGLIAGAWFSVAGRNSSAFAGGAISVTYGW